MSQNAKANYLISYLWYRTGNWEKRNLLRRDA